VPDPENWDSGDVMETPENGIEGGAFENNDDKVGMASCSAGWAVWKRQVRPETLLAIVITDHPMMGHDEKGRRN
jgi:hypothetical protein